MKKYFINLMAVTLLCMELAACGGNSTGSNTSEIPSDGVLGKYGPEIYEMMTEIEFTIPQTIEEIQKKAREENNIDAVENEGQLKEYMGKFEEVDKQCDELKAKRETLREQLKQKVQEASEALRGKEIATVIEEGTPLKVIEPFKIMELKGDLLMICESVVELAKESPADYMHHYNKSLLMTVECKNDSDDIVPASRKSDVSIVGGDWPNKTYPIGTRFKITTEIRAGLSSTGISKGLFQIHHLTISWSENHFVLGKMKLGPIEIDKPIANIPTSVTGLYDKYEHKTETHEDDMDGEWVEDYFLFTYKGKEAFRVDLMDGKVYSISLLEGSTNVKTIDGIYVGFSARELFKQKKTDWETDFAGWVFGSFRDYTYYVKSGDLVNINSEVPRKAEDFKENAKIARITYR